MKNKEQIAKIWDVLDSLNIDVLQNKKDISRIDEVLSVSNLWEPQKPKLKQLDQSIFDGLDENWRFAAVDGCTGRAYVYEQKPHFFHGKDYWRIHEGLQRIIGHDYDASNWQNSLIERDIAKELLDVDLSSELTGSELCKAMLARGDVCVPCFVAWDSDVEAIADKSIRLVHEFLPEAPNFHAGLEDFYCAVPINTRTGEPLTASEVGL